MSQRKAFVLSASLLLLSAAAHAGQENRGVSLCSSASAICRSDEDKVLVCLFEQADLAYVALETSPNETSDRYRVRKIPHAPGLMGAPERYEGQGFEISIVTDAAPSEGGVPATLSVTDLGVQDVSLRCRFQ